MRIAHSGALPPSTPGIAALAVAVCACLGLGCKDKQQPENKPNAGEPARVEPTRKPPELETPEVSGPGLVKVRSLGAKITYTRHEITVDGETVITIGPDGLVERSRYAVLMTVLEGKVRSDDPLGIQFTASLPYLRVGELLGALRQSGFRNLALLAGDGSTMIPVELPDPEEANAGGLRPVVTLKGGRLTLWSASGEEGTRTAPRLDINFDGTKALDALTDELVKIVQRRWPDGKRANVDRTIIVQIEANETAEAALRVLAAVRAVGGRELFPNIFLAGGA
jgi:hypothetical protein